jgi:hypothetical protein
MMSAFLVEEKTLHKILSHIRYEIRKSTWLKNKFEEELGLDFSNLYWQTHLGQKMWDLNQLSLGYRYGDKPIVLAYTFHPVLCTPIQAFKALQCWRYQCTEGEIPETSKLYTFFDSVVIPALAEAIIMRSPEYDQAEWG